MPYTVRNYVEKKMVSILIFNICVGATFLSAGNVCKMAARQSIYTYNLETHVKMHSAKTYLITLKQYTNMDFSAGGHDVLCTGN